MTKIASAASVDRFLQRKLPEEQYRLLRGHEPCIVTIDETGKAIKYVVLADDSIMLCENPPKRTTHLLHYKDILDVEVSHELPAFLKAEKSQKVGHIKIILKKTRGQLPDEAPFTSSRPSLGSVSPALRSSARSPSASMRSVSPLESEPEPLPAAALSPRWSLRPDDLPTSAQRAALASSTRKTGSLLTLPIPAPGPAPKRMSLSASPGPTRATSPRPRSPRSSTTPELREDHENDSFSLNTRGSMTSLSSSLSNLTTMATEASCVHLYTLQEGVCCQHSPCSRRQHSPYSRRHVFLCYC